MKCVSYSLNLSRVKTFVHFVGFSQSAKVLTSKHLNWFFPQNNYDYVVLCKYFSLQIMSLLKYLKRESILLHPNGPLSQSVPSSSIAAANKVVEGICLEYGGHQAGHSTAGPYMWLIRAIYC